ncbi:Hypothetical predicted protein [Marmota monax]|nr:phospholemman [Marmota monax]VTJ55860.1 Hypothetical predicted protein [Marmota monax]
MQKRHRNTTHSPMTTNPCGSEASPSPESSSSWASSSFSARDADASSTSNRELGNPMKRRELSAAPSAVSPPAGGRNTWCHGTRPGFPWHLMRPTHLLLTCHLDCPLSQPCPTESPSLSDFQ